METFFIACKGKTGINFKLCLPDPLAYSTAVFTISSLARLDQLFINVKLRVLRNLKKVWVENHWHKRSVFHECSTFLITEIFQELLLIMIVVFIFCLKSGFVKLLFQNSFRVSKVEVRHARSSLEQGSFQKAVPFYHNWPIIFHLKNGQAFWFSVIIQTSWWNCVKDVCRIWIENLTLSAFIIFR